MSSIDGAAGGGLTPWAVTGSYATEGQVGATAFLTRATLKDYALTDYGVAVGYKDRYCKLHKTTSAPLVVEAESAHKGAADNISAVKDSEI